LQSSRRLRARASIHSLKRPCNNAWPRETDCSRTYFPAGCSAGTGCVPDAGRRRGGMTTNRSWNYGRIRSRLCSDGAQA
jgi:hypothetical protein